MSVVRAASSFSALGTTCAVVTIDDAGREAAVAAVRREVASIDRACSRFRRDSELTRVNASAGRWVSIGAVLAEALVVAMRAAVRTDGIVDPTVGGALLSLGYTRDFQTSPPPATPRLRLVPAGRWREIELDAELARVRLPDGVSLDLGATAKSLAADRAATAAARVCGGVLVSLGGDIRVVGTAPAAGWCVRLADDHRAPLDGDGPTVSIRSGGLATSSTTVRRWHRGGELVHHIVDPATGAPAARVWRTVSIAAATCTDANVAATASIVLGHGAPCWLEQLSLPARLVRESGAVTTVSGWPAEAGAPEAPDDH